MSQVGQPGHVGHVGHVAAGHADASSPYQLAIVSIKLAVTRQSRVLGIPPYIVSSLVACSKSSDFVCVLWTQCKELKLLPLTRDVP